MKQNAVLSGIDTRGNPKYQHGGFGNDAYLRFDPRVMDALDVKPSSKVCYTIIVCS